MDLQDLLKKYAVKNAVEHGSADVNAVVGKVFAEDPGLKDRADEVVATAGEVVEEVNSLPGDELAALEEEYEYVEREEDDDYLPPLPNVEDEVVMRMAPFPSGLLHVGNARMAVLNDEYVKRYGGRLLLVIDDTAGSEEKKPIEEAYEEIPKDLEWLGVEFDEVVYKSDRLDLFHDYGRKFLEEGWAYVCECDAGTLRENRREGKECEHRSRSVGENLEKWEEMLSGGYAEGEAVVRLKTDMEDPDAAFRDRVLLRISDIDHPRVGKEYRVWPMLEFSWAIDDHELGITHVLRGKDLVMEDRMERYMWDLLGWEHPEILHHGLLQIEGIKISTSGAKRKIDSGDYTGWEDPRTWSLKSLRRRGFEPGAVRNFVLHFGMSENNAVVPLETLYTENRKLIDGKSDRYFFVSDPVRIDIEKGEELVASIPRHPEEDRGERMVRLEPDDGSISVYVEREDLEEGFLRLKDLCNVEIEGEGAKFHSEGHEEAIERNAPIVQWVPEDGLECDVLMPDGETVSGLCEREVPEEVIQFVRFGFVNVLESGDAVKAYYTHP